MLVCPCLSVPVQSRSDVLPTHTHTHTQASTHARTHAHTHMKENNRHDGNWCQSDLRY